VATSVFVVSTGYLFLVIGIAVGYIAIRSTIF